MSITSVQAATAEIKVLSAGAIKTGLANLAKAYHEEGGHEVIITFYAAGLLVNASTPETAEKFIRFLTTLYAKETFSSTGVK